MDHELGTVDSHLLNDTSAQLRPTDTHVTSITTERETELPTDRSRNRMECPPMSVTINRSPVTSVGSTECWPRKRVLYSEATSTVGFSSGLVTESCHRHTTRYLDRSWKIGNLGKQTLESLTTTGWFNSWLFINNNPSGLPVSKTLTLALTQSKPTSPYWYTRCRLLNQTKTRNEHSLGNLWSSHTTSNVELMMTVFLPLNGSLFSTPVLVCPLRLSLDLLNRQRFFFRHFWGSFADFPIVRNVATLRSKTM